MLAVKTPEEVLRLIGKEFRPLGRTEIVPLAQAPGRVLAEAGDEGTVPGIDQLLHVVGAVALDHGDGRYGHVRDDARVADAAADQKEHLVSGLRASVVAALRLIILCGITATPQNSLVEIHKTALGAEESVEWIYSDDCVKCVKELNDNGYTTIAVEQVEGSTKLDEFVVDSSARYALVFGNEVKGVNQEVVDICKISLEITQFGTKHSLNVSVTAGLVIWEFFKQLKDML